MIDSDPLLSGKYHLPNRFVHSAWNCGGHAEVAEEAEDAEDFVQSSVSSAPPAYSA